MPPVAVTARSGPAGDTDADTRVVAVFEGEPLDEPDLQALVDSGEAKPALRKLAVVHVDGRRVILAGLGRRDGLGPERARVAAAVAAGRARELGARSLSWAAPSDDERVAGALVEGTLLALYRFDRFKSGDDSDDEAVESLEIASGGELARAVARARIVTDAQNAARDRHNLPANVAGPRSHTVRARGLPDVH